MDGDNVGDKNGQMVNERGRNWKDDKSDPAKILILHSNKSNECKVIFVWDRMSNIRTIKLVKFLKLTPSDFFCSITSEGLFANFTKDY